MAAARSRSSRRLGRGLASLMPAPVDATPSPSPAAAPPPREAAISAADEASVREGLVELAIEQIIPNPSQPRRDFDEAALQSLATSIEASGLLQPVIVRPAPGHPDQYELVAGERRWRAARLAGLTTIAAIVRNTNNQQSAELALVENVQRLDLNPMERAEAFASLVERFHVSHQDVASRVGLDRSSVANLIRLLQLPVDVQDLIRSGTLGLGHGKALAGVTDPQHCSTLAARCASGQWSVRKLEQEAARLRDGGGDRPTAPARERPPHVVDLENRLAKHLGTSVRLHESRKKGRGRIVIAFYDLDQFDGILQKLGLGDDLA
jgi:ParB family chromosome partitioning protein